MLIDSRCQDRLNIKVARIFNTCGPPKHVNGGLVVSNLIVQALKHEPSTLHGGAYETSSFCHVDDLIESCVRLMDTDEGFTSPLNLANPGEFSMIEVLEKVNSLTVSGSE